jgi:hypothetical protein
MVKKAQIIFNNLCKMAAIEITTLEDGIITN